MSEQNQTMRGKRKKSRPSTLALVLFPLCAMAGAFWLLNEYNSAALQWNFLYPRLMRPLMTMLVSLGIGLGVGLIIEASGWASFLARFASPITRWGRLSETSGAAFTTAFFSGTAANTMLMSAHTSSCISYAEMRASYLINTGLPGFLLHLPTTFFIIVPITRSAGLIYLGLTGCAACLRTVLLLCLARYSITKEGKSKGSTACSTPKKREPLSWRVVGRRFEKRFARLIIFTVPMYCLIFALNQAGMFEYLRQSAAEGLVSSATGGFLPVEAVSLVVFAVAAEFSSGIAAAGALLQEGALSTVQVVVALVLGTIAATPIRAIRHQLPAHAGVFSPRLAVVFLLQSQFCRITSLVGVTAVYLYFSL